MQKNLKGFTFVELLIVSAIMMVLMAMTVPAVDALRSDIALGRTIRQVKISILSTLSYSMAGKSIASLTARSPMDLSLMPGVYALHFRAADDYGEDEPYHYLEGSVGIDSVGNSSGKIIYANENESASDVVFLKEIRLKENAEDAGNPVNSVTVFFTPPLGKIFITSQPDASITQEGGLFSPIPLFEAADANRFVELDFQYKEETDKVMTLRLGIDKTINVL